MEVPQPDMTAVEDVVLATKVVVCAAARPSVAKTLSIVEVVVKQESEEGKMQGCLWSSTARKALNNKANRKRSRTREEQNDHLMTTCRAHGAASLRDGHEARKAATPHIFYPLGGYQRPSEKRLQVAAHIDHVDGDRNSQDATKLRMRFRDSSLSVKRGVQIDDHISGWPCDDMLEDPQTRSHHTVRDCLSMDRLDDMSTVFEPPVIGRLKWFHID
nr:hypothetical protein CFP56_23998 [Quercus suber]